MIRKVCCIYVISSRLYGQQLNVPIRCLTCEVFSEAEIRTEGGTINLISPAVVYPFRANYSLINIGQCAKASAYANSKRVPNASVDAIKIIIAIAGW